MAWSKLKIFCALHRPAGKIQVGYHLMVILCSFVTGFLLNILNLQPNASWSLVATASIDFVLTVVLTVETVLQLWSSSCNEYYRNCKGKLRYLYSHLAYKTLDTVGIVTYVAFCIRMLYFKSNLISHTLLTIGHVTQVLQIYRLTHQQLKLMARTIRLKIGFILSIFLFTLVSFLFLSRFIYMLERDKNPMIITIFDANWLVFMTILSVGYGDIQPVTIEGKIVLMCVAFLGLASFSVMISLCGAQLASEKEKTTIVSLIPAASLIQNGWVLYMMKTGAYWKSSNISLKERDRRAMICLQKIKYLVSRRHFKVTQSDIMTFDENILLYEHLLNRLNFVEKNIYHNSYRLNSLNSQIDTIIKEFVQQRK